MVYTLEQFGSGHGKRGLVVSSSDSCDLPLAPLILQVAPLTLQVAPLMLQVAPLTLLVAHLTLLVVLPPLTFSKTRSLSFGKAIVGMVHVPLKKDLKILHIYGLYKVGWLVVLRIYVALAVFQPYRDLEALKFMW